MAIEKIKLTSESTQITQKKINYNFTELDLNKVNVDGSKVLSDNNYTNADKEKLANIENNAEVNVIEQINVNGTPQAVSNKTVNLTITDNSLIGNKINASINPSNYVMTISLLNSADESLSSATVDLPLETMVVNATYSNGTLTLELQNGNTVDVDISSLISGLVPDSRTINNKPLTSNITLTPTDIGTYSTTDIDNALGGKVDKVSGKGLSTNDYTTEEKNKLSGIESGAEVNDISAIQVNGVDVTPTDKKINITNGGNVTVSSSGNSISLNVDTSSFSQNTEYDFTSDDSRWGELDSNGFYTLAIQSDKTAFLVLNSNGEQVMAGLKSTGELIQVITDTKFAGKVVAY